MSEPLSLSDRSVKLYADCVFTSPLQIHGHSGCSTQASLQPHASCSSFLHGASSHPMPRSEATSGENRNVREA